MQHSDVSGGSAVQPSRCHNRLGRLGNYSQDQACSYPRRIGGRWRARLDLFIAPAILAECAEQVNRPFQTWLPFLLATPDLLHSTCIYYTVRLEVETVHPVQDVQLHFNTPKATDQIVLARKSHGASRALPSRLTSYHADISGVHSFTRGQIKSQSARISSCASSLLRRSMKCSTLRRLKLTTKC